MATRGNILPVLNYSPLEICKAIGARLRARRLQLGWSRKTLATRTGVNPWSLKRFEVSGQIALEGLVKLSIVLGTVGDFEDLFAARPGEPASMDELERLNPPIRVRGTTLR
jgi:transcriptional regulator with XRE-family HTH domain